ncbi:MAG: M23 family metallopeptidase, partial [Desulfitobacterium sp.]|nr:M23 family metallopeptidase [Desulfitobacterium sp.]
NYSLPFQGRWTVVNGGVDKDASHSWGIPTQRYAYDFVIMDEEGGTCSGDPTVLENYYCYGKEVLAPADGVVVDAKDHYKDSRTYGNGKTDPFIKDIRGNYIVIKHGSKEYSVIAHLLPHSLKVKIGDKVKRGEIIAKCGNSGNTTEPHIHFQIQDGRSFLASAGLPICFKDIQQEPIQNYHKFDPRPLPKPLEEGSPFIQRGNLVGNIIGMAKR